MEQKDCKQNGDFDFTLLTDFFRRLDRQGPGSDDQTRLALGFIEGLAGMRRIADIGCGTGGQTVTLARETGAHITAVDIFPRMLETLSERVAAAGLSDRITPLAASMYELPFSDGQFDMIWAEGSIYNIGFEKGLREWRRFLKPGGWIAVSEESWFTPSRPRELEEYWVGAYPYIDTIHRNLSKMWEAGYSPAAHFILPERCWEENFYEPMERIFEPFLGDHADSAAAREMVEEMRRENEMYQRYKGYCGYVFYIGKAV